jgi:hypothetical protein
VAGAPQGCAVFDECACVFQPGWARAEDRDSLLELLEWDRLLNKRIHAQGDPDRSGGAEAPRLGQLLCG